MNKPGLLYYCQCVDGVSGLIRAFTIANRLTDRFRVVVLNGGLPPAGTNVPGNIGFIQLPSRTANTDSNDDSPGARPAMQDQLAARREMILENYAQLRPQVLLLESFPFGQSTIADDLMPLVESARHSLFDQPLIICSVIDILPGGRQEYEGHDEETTTLLEKYVDALIVHSDPNFARFEEFFQPRNALTTPVYHSGFVVRDRGPLPQADRREKRILVSAGCGIHGEALFKAAAEAHRLIWDVDQLPMTIVSGCRFPEHEWENLQKIAQDRHGLELKRSVPDLGAEFGKVCWAVSQCEYNAAVDVMATGVSALLMPGTGDGQSDQIDRLQRMSHWQAARTLMPRHLNGATLANSIYQLIKFEPAATSFNLDGAEITANIIYDFAHSGGVRPGSLRPNATTNRPWLH